ALGLSLFFLGSPPGIAERAAAELQRDFPGLRIGVHHGFFDKTPGSAENDAVVAQINRARPDILLIGFGMPLQEHWLRQNWAALDVGVTVTVGALFDYVAQVVPRAPRWITDHGFEWLAR